MNKNSSVIKNCLLIIATASLQCINHKKIKDLLTIYYSRFWLLHASCNTTNFYGKTFNLEIKFENIQKTDKPIYVELYQPEKDFNNKKNFTLALPSLFSTPTILLPIVAIP